MQDACCNQLPDHACKMRRNAGRRVVRILRPGGPRKQYEDITAAQRKRNWNSSTVRLRDRETVLRDRATRSRGESTSGRRHRVCCGFVAAVPSSMPTCASRPSTDSRLHTSGKLPAVYREEDAKQVEPLLERWRGNGLSSQEAVKLIDMLYVTGQTLYDCDELAEWKTFVINTSSTGSTTMSDFGTPMPSWRTARRLAGQEGSLQGPPSRVSGLPQHGVILG